MRRKVALTAAAVAMVGTLAVGGTLAWFTDTETATNVVTTGNVDIALNENGGNDGVADESGLTYDDVMPGDVFTKEVTVENKGNDAYVRAIIEVTGVDMMGDEPISFIKDEVTQDWIWSGPNEDGTYTATVAYDGIFAKDGDAWKIFDSIEIPTAWDNGHENAKFNVKVTVEAIQAENNETDPWAANIDYDAQDTLKETDMEGTNTDTIE